MSRNMLYIIGGVLVLLVGGVFLINNSMNSDSQTSTGSVSESDNTSQVQASPSDEEKALDASSSAGDTVQGADKVKEFTVMGSSLKFAPATLTVNKGDQVKITFKNNGGTHDFVIDEFSVKSDTLQSNEDTTVEFTADQAGSFEYYCSVANHRQMGMKGTLVVK